MLYIAAFGLSILSLSLGRSYPGTHRAEHLVMTLAFTACLIAAHFKKSGSFNFFTYILIPLVLGFLFLGGDFPEGPLLAAAIYIILTLHRILRDNRLLMRG